MTLGRSASRLALGTDGRPAELPEVGLRGLGLHPLSAAECVDFVLDELDRGRGGWIVANDLTTFLRSERDPGYRDQCEQATLRIPTARLLVWACRLQRTPLPECVELEALIDDLAAECASGSRKLFLVDTSEERLERAQAVLVERYPDLDVATCAAPAGGVDADPVAMARLSRKVDEARPDVVLVGLDSPAQEGVIRFLRHDRPEAWWIGVGEVLRFLAGEFTHAPTWARRAGLGWVVPSLQRPGRVLPRYFASLVHGTMLLARCSVRGTLPKRKTASAYGRRLPKALLVDDDQHALDQLELLLSSRFPDLRIETRTSPDVSGTFDFYFLDNDFDGQRLAGKMARRIRAERPSATIIAFSGVLDVETLKRLINVGCDGVCDKAEPSSWRPIIELIDARLGGMVARQRTEHMAFGGVRHSAHSIGNLLRDWNDRNPQPDEAEPEKAVR